ncbi:MAG: hypothetical protein NT007_17590 [Candidatus Kapabacteria bacterium]|nr:hypothetical protein [Candidatus Kapabacteria bacterium]
MTNLLIVFFFLINYALFSFSGKGSGTETDPYQITTMAELQEMDQTYETSYIIMNDLDATDFDLFILILGKGTILNGNGHIIKHLKSCGLVDLCNGCNIKKLGIEYDTVHCQRGAGFVHYIESKASYLNVIIVEFL